MDVKEELNNISLQDPMLIEWIWQTAIDSCKLLQPMFNSDTCKLLLNLILVSKKRCYKIIILILLGEVIVILLDNLSFA